MLVPRRLTISMGGEPLRVLALHAVVWDRERSIFAMPDGIAAPVERPGPAALPPAPLAPEARAIADGVWLAPDVRPGMNAFFVRQPDGVTVFEAPAGFLYPQIEIPPPDLARGRRSSEPGEALVDLVRRTVPGAPIRRLVISHAHADHAGGVRAFAAEGAEIVVPQGAAEPVRRFLAERFVREPDRWERRRTTTPATLREVDGARDVRRRRARFEVIAVGANPHAAAMAVMWLPETRLLLQGDLYYAEPLDDFPSPSRVPIMKWFAAWLGARGHRPARDLGHAQRAAGDARALREARRDRRLSAPQRPAIPPAVGAAASRPVTRRNTRVKCAWSAKPRSRATSTSASAPAAYPPLRLVDAQAPLRVAERAAPEAPPCPRQVDRVDPDARGQPRGRQPGPVLGAQDLLGSRGAGRSCRGGRMVGAVGFEPTTSTV